MRIKHLLEGTEPKLPGAPSGIKVMTPQQFVAKSQGEEEQDVEENKLYFKKLSSEKELVEHAKRFSKNLQLDGIPITSKNRHTVVCSTIFAHSKKQLNESTHISGGKQAINLLKRLDQFPNLSIRVGEKVAIINAQLQGDSMELWGFATPKTITKIYRDPAEGSIKQFEFNNDPDDVWPRTENAEYNGQFLMYSAFFGDKKSADHALTLLTLQSSEDLNIRNHISEGIGREPQVGDEVYYGTRLVGWFKGYSKYGKIITEPNVKEMGDEYFNKDVYWEPQEHLTIKPKQGVDEATKLPAQSRELKGDELTSYLDRIRKQEKSKTDKYKMPYIHRSSVMGYYDEAGKKYNVDAIKNALAQRPKALLKKNEKMKHSDGELEQFFNIGFAALTGIALDEQTNELIIVNTCPGAGSCKIDCFAMKGGKIQFQGPWLSDGRILTYLLNDPDGFFNQLKAEIQKEEIKGKKGGYKVSIRWHDAGDFFSPEYAGLAFKLAKELPNVDFYAYTKLAGVALGEKPANFMINWSEGAHPSQERQVKAHDPQLEKTKNSRIVPSNLFYDLLVKDEKKNLVKGPEGQWQVIPDKLPELKQRLAKEYGISPNSILSYKEWDLKGKKIPNMKWNVIIAPGEPDLTAKDPGVLSTLLLKH